MKLNIIRNSVKVLALLLGTTLVVAACQREELARPDGLAFGDGVVRFAPEIASGEGVAVKSADTYRGVPVSFGELTSEDGTFTMPISCAVSTIDEPATKATLINDPGTATGTVKPLGDFAKSIDNTFWVTAWNDAATPSRIIPDQVMSGYTTTDGKYQKVMYRTKDVAGNDLAAPYWMTMQPMPTELNPGVSATGPADDEYIWKKINTDHAETKTFFAYANLPEGATVANTAATSQTLTLTALPDKDILLGYYSGEGYSGEPEKLTGTASIHFHHPLTAVKFKKGTLSEGVSITGISINGVYTEGKTIHSAAAPSTFTWTDTDGNETVSLSSVSVDEDGYIGESILLIPETFTSDNTRITVSLTTPTGAKTVYYPLKGLTFSAGCINVFTIGYDTYKFTFELVKSEDATQTFTNTTAESSVTIGITSKKKDVSGESNESWRIQSYRLGSGSPVDVRSTTFTGGGLEVTKSGSNLKIKSLKRTSTYGSHDYWVNSMKRTDRLDWSPAAWSGVTDLSRLDFKRDIRDIHSMTTANCYIIRHAGTYKFPLVYGNGVIDGTENSAPFTDAEHINHLGAEISSAFIENNDGCTAASCEILWQDEAAVIKYPEIVGETVSGDYDASNVRYIQFTVDEETICQNNALIAVKDGDGKTIWSWHIWMTNDPTMMADAIPVINRSSVTYHFFPLYSLGLVDYNFAARETVVITLEQTNSGETVTVTVNQPFKLDVSHGNGTYYQWGRKDPMCRINTPAGGTFTRNASGPVSLSEAIQNPDNFYNDGGTQNWCVANYLYLWTGQNKRIKTIYDPSPVGYIVPAMNAYTFALQSGTSSESPELFNVDGEFSGGWNFYTGGWKTGETTFFAASGYRNYSNGTISDVGKNGRMWSSSEIDGAQAYAFNYNETLIRIQYNNFRANGFSIRPVKE